METLWQDMKYEARMLARNPGFTAVAVLTLALGIGATTAIFSVANGVLLAPLPYPHPDRLAFIWSDLDKAGYVRAPLSGPELADLRRRSQLFEDFGAIWATSASLVEEGRPESIRVGLVTANLLSVVGVQPELGRLFLPTEEGLTAPRAIVLSGGLWQRRFGGERDIVGRSIRVDGGWGFPGGTYTVVGVLPSEFKLILPADASVPAPLDAWVPFPTDLPQAPRDAYYLRTLGRVRPGVALAEAQAEVRTIGRRLEAEFPHYAASGRSFYAVSLHQDAVRQVRPAMLALLGGVAVVLLIACANVANLLLARASARGKEISLRVALGASRGRIVSQLLVESLMLAALGGLLGGAVAQWGLSALLAFQPGSLPRVEAIEVDLGVLGFAAVLSLGSGLLFGLAPVLEALKVDLAETLRAAGRSVNAGRRGRTRNLLVVGEVALGFVLLISTGLLLLTFVRLLGVDPGFRPQGVLTFQLSLPPERYPTQKDMANFSREVERSLAGLPGVEAAGAINELPLDDRPNWSTPYLFEEARDQPRGSYEADARVITPGYFSAIGAELVQGRFFDELDNEEGRKVVIVDELLARRAWPGKNPLGRQLQVDLWQGAGFVPAWAEVVGVVKHVRHHTLAKAVREQVFMPFAQGPRNEMGFAVRTQGKPGSLVDAIRAEIGELDKDLAASEFLFLNQYVSEALAGPRFTLILAVVFAGLALLLASVGLYGVVAYSVGQRTREIGVRMALGAEPTRIFQMVMGEGLRLALLGLALGLAGALAATRLLKGLLFGVTPTEPVIFAAVSALLVLVALLACWVPARRATRVDPMVALRYE